MLLQHLLIAAAFAASASAQQSALIISPPFSQEEFTGTVIPHFQGADAVAVFKRYRHSVEDNGKVLSIPPKDEFETSTQYAERRARQSNQAPVREFVLSFVLPSDSYLARLEKVGMGIASPVHMTYDADRQVWTVAISSQSEIRDNYAGIKKKDFFSAIDWGVEGSWNTSYKGTNAYGASVDVSSGGRDDYGIAFHRSKRWGKDGHYVLTIPMTVNKARDVKPRLRVLMICTVNAADPVYASSYDTTATFKDPSESHLQFHYLHVIPRELWVFDTETGEVLAKASDIGF